MFSQTKFCPSRCCNFFGGRGGGGIGIGKLSRKLIILCCKVPPEHTQPLISSRLVYIFVYLYRLGVSLQKFPHYLIDVKLCRLQQVAIGKLQSYGLLFDRLYTLFDRLYTLRVNTHRMGKESSFKIILISVKQVTC